MKFYFDFRYDVSCDIFQLFSNFLITWIINHMFETINTIEIIFEISLPKIIQDLYTAETFFMESFFCLTLLEIWAIKFWIKFIRKRMVVMNEEFIVNCLTFVNLVISALWGIGKVFTDDLNGWLPLHQNVFKAPRGRK